MILDEVPHHCDAVWIINDGHLDSPLPEQFFCAKKIPILSDDDARNPVKQGSAGAHDARTQCAHEGQLRPVAPTSGVAHADRFGVGGGISGLHAEIVAASNDVACAIGEDGADGEPSFGKSGAGFGERGREKCVRVHDGEIQFRLSLSMASRSRPLNRCGSSIIKKCPTPGMKIT